MQVFVSPARLPLCCDAKAAISQRGSATTHDNSLDTHKQYVTSNALRTFSRRAASSKRANARQVRVAQRNTKHASADAEQAASTSSLCLAVAAFYFCIECRALLVASALQISNLSKLVQLWLANQRSTNSPTCDQFHAGAAQSLAGWLQGTFARQRAVDLAALAAIVAEACGKRRLARRCFLLLRLW